MGEDTLVLEIAFKRFLSPMLTIKVSKTRGGDKQLKTEYLPCR